jgi:shikimate dehydrogenase
MHNAALRAVGLDGWRYQRLPVPPDLFEETVRGLALVDFLGANVTIPHKASALVLADSASEAAREIGAANTLTFAPDGSIAADNTDGPGLIEALGESARGATALVLGAGGSARAAVWGLQRAGASEVAVWNRTPERAQELARALGARFVEDPISADVLVNCTSVGLAEDPGGGAADAGAEAPGRSSSDEGSRNDRGAGLERSATQGCALNQLRVTFDQVGEYRHVVDFVYRTGTTPLMAAAHAHGVRTTDGLELLLAQGALSFEAWTHRAAPREEMRAALRAEEPR